jgi:putative alpha-1,2-mannosidase
MSIKNNSSRTLEYVYNDFCTSIGKSFGSKEEVEMFKDRSLWYKNLWDNRLEIDEGKMGLATAFDPFNNATEPTTKDMLIL